MRVIQISVERSEHHSVPLMVGAWEVLVLQFEYGPEKVVVLGPKKLEGRNYPDAHQEFDRLQQRYGIDTDTGATKASIVFGQGAMGAMTLRNLIEQERKLESEEELEVVSLTSNVVSIDPPTPAPVATPAAPAVIEPKQPLGLKSKTA
jgi:hypothetical protein